MKILAILSAGLLLISCSRKSPPSVHHTYTVTFAVAMIPDALLESYGGRFTPEKGYDFARLEDRSTLAKYLLEHPDKYPFYGPDSRWTPLVRTGQTAGMKLTVSLTQEDKSFASHGIRLKRFDAVINVQGEDATGQIACSWDCNYWVELKKPIGNSTEQGGSRPSGFALKPGHPDMTPFFNAEGMTLWMIVGLDHS